MSEFQFTLLFINITLIQELERIANVSQTIEKEPIKRQHVKGNVYPLCPRCQGQGAAPIRLRAPASMITPEITQKSNEFDCNEWNCLRNPRLFAGIKILRIEIILRDCLYEYKLFTILGPFNT